MIGATGQQGGAVVQALLERGWTLHAFVRDARRPAARSLATIVATLITGDLDDRASLLAAMRLVSGVFLVLTMMTGPRATLEGVVAAGQGHRRRRPGGRRRASRVKFDGGGRPPHRHPARGEQGPDRGTRHVAGLPATFLRPTSFADNFETFTRPSIVDGELVVSLALMAETRLRMIATRDIGVFAAIAFDLRDVSLASIS